MSLELTEKEQARSDHLFQQVHKYLSFKDSRQANSGIAKYRSAMKSFCDFTAKNFGLRNLNNISNKHLAAFAQHRQEIGIAGVKTELSAIRKFHSKLENPRYKELETDNSKLGIEERKIVEDGRNIVDRAWTDEEFKKACDVAESYDNSDIANAFEIARFGGLRINEVTALTKSQIRNGLKAGFFVVTHTKGDVARMSFIESNEYRQSLERALHQAKSEHIFQGHGRTHEQAKKRIQNFINTHRHKWSDVESNNKQAVDDSDSRVRENLSFHGLRHAYAREKYRENLSKGMNDKQARKDVAVKLGHGRDEITKVYL